MTISKVFYRPIRQAPYFEQWQQENSNDEDNIRSSQRRMSVTGSQRSTMTDTTTAVSAAELLRQRRSSIGSNSTTNMAAAAVANNTTNEADAAAGGAGSTNSVNRVSSFQLLARSASMETLLMRSGGTTNGTSATLDLIEGDNNNETNQQHQNQQQSHQQHQLEQLRRRLLQPRSLLTLSSNAPAANAMISPQPDWRLRDRMKTVGVGLIVALNVGTDPPDIVKPHPCAVLQCWMDPRTVSRTKAKEMIGERLERQYAKWQLARAARPLKYRKALDPTVEDVRNLCLRLRTQARNERILVHYNGHGVPRPTDHGEIWVFDKNHTEYIPLSVADLRQWMGKPSIVVLDCSAAGILIPFWTAAMAATAEQENNSPAQNAATTTTGGPPPNSLLNPMHNTNTGTASSSAAPPKHTTNTAPTTMDEQASQWVRDTIILCPCSEGEWLPMHPDYPADIFTSCLTTPIPIALRWFVRRSGMFQAAGLHPDAVDAIPGKANDRKTPLGELNWIFTAVTDSIAWNVLPKPLFQRLFRQDLLVASMFRNFLLADRILRSFGCCTPVSYPPLPSNSMAHHPLWKAWDLVCETMLFQLMKDGVFHNSNHLFANKTQPTSSSSSTTATAATASGGSGSGSKNGEENTETGAETTSGEATTAATQQQVATTATTSPSVSSPFFSEQLTAFEVWLELASVHKMQLASGIVLESPEQLPVVLQVLLSQVHRIRALKLLQRFLDLGPWAVNLSLSLGIFPYVMKLLQSPEYKSLLVRIWASILAFDPSCRVDVLKDGAIHHFVQHLLYGLNGPQPSTAAGGGASTTTASSSRGIGEGSDVSQAANERTLAAFVLAAICHEYPAGQTECVRLNLHGNCCVLLSSYEQGEQQKQNQQQTAKAQPFNTNKPVENSHNNINDAALEEHLPPHFRLWLCICLANMAKDNIHVQNEAYSAGVHQRLASRLSDKNPEVRAAACYALGNLVGSQAKEPSGSPSLQGMGSMQKQQPAQSQQRQSLLPQRLAQAANIVADIIPSQPYPSLTPGGIGGTLGGFNSSQPGLNPPQPGLNPSNAIPVGLSVAQGNPMLMQQQQQQQAQQLLQLRHHQQRLLNPNQHPQMTPQHPNMPGNAGGLLMSAGSGIQGMSPQHQMQSPMIGMSISPPGQQFSSQQPNQPFSSSPMEQSRGMLMVKPTVFEDRNRLELDLTCLEMILRSAVHDGSVVVRYEAAIALGGSVGKYLEAFVVVAEETSAVTSSPSASDDRKKSFAPPRGLDRSNLDRFGNIWKAIRNLQRSDPFPAISKAANTIVSFVHDTLLRFRVESEKQAEQMAAHSKRLASLLSGIDEELTTPADGLDLSSSIQSTNTASHGIGRVANPNDMRRVSSEVVRSNAPVASMEASANLLSSSQHRKIPARPLDDGALSSYVLPKSEFYEWKKNSFDPNFDVPEDDEHPDPDPLSPTGAARAYQDRRNFVVRETGMKLAERYASLAPKPPTPKKKSIELILEEEDESALLAAEEQASAKKSELELKEKKLFRNDGVKMTSLVNFHPFEDYLMACGATDIVTLWDTESGKRLTKFENGNPKGSRMTSSFWINEESSSMFLVGSNDGAVKIWSNILESNGDSSSTPPSLMSSFFAAPMEVGNWGSGLVLEWQPFSGILLAGGNSKFIRCWDLEAEKVIHKFDTNCEAYVTTLTTAWDYDSLGLGLAPQGYNGIGRDIIVAGHSDGSLKVFDIRMSGVASDMRGTPGHIPPTGRRQRTRATAYNEHKTWVVNTAFTGHSGRYELISGTVGGEIKAWDLRMSTSIRTIEAQRSTMTTLAVHSKIPIVATGSHAQFIKVLTLDGDTMQVLRYHEKMASHRIGPVSCLAFHPHKALLAAGATDTYIGLYTTKQQILR